MSTSTPTFKKTVIFNSFDRCTEITASLTSSPARAAANNFIYSQNDWKEEAFVVAEVINNLTNVKLADALES